MRPSTILCLDLETAGLLETDPVIEVGAVLYSVEHAAVIDCYSAIIHAEENPAVAVNGIPAGILRDASRNADPWSHVVQLALRADVIAAHNVAFDKPRCPMSLQAIKPWIDTMDCAFPKPTTSRSLVAICLAHGVPVTHAHRALTDAMLIARLLERCAEIGSDVGAILERAMLPRVKVIAMQPFEQNDEARAAGFAFDRPSRTWSKRVIADEVPGLQSSLPFRTRIEASP